MKLVRTTIYAAVLSILFGATTVSHAANVSSTKFFVSNNQGEISIQHAYGRLVGDEQSALMSETISLWQKNHVEQGRFENILGTYRMASNKQTGDNTEVFISSPYQHFSNNQAFTLARDLANTFGQESVAVFVPSSQANVADIVVRFPGKKPTIKQAIRLIREKIPAYANAFSLHLSNTRTGFHSARVAAIEWLGSKVNVNEIKNVFPNDMVSYCYGKAYLIYKTGQIKAI